MDKMSGFQSGEQLSFFPIPLQALYAQSYQNGSLIPQTKRSSSNHEFRCAAYSDVNPCKGHLVQFQNQAISIWISYNAQLSCLQFHFTTVFSLPSLPCGDPQHSLRDISRRLLRYQVTFISQRGDLAIPPCKRVPFEQAIMIRVFCCLAE